MLAAVENIFPPVPADVAVALGAFLAGRGHMNAGLVFTLAWVANVGSAAGVYALARRHGALVSRGFLGRHIFTPNTIAHIEEQYRRHGAYGIFLSRLLPVWRGGLGVEGHVRSARAVVEAGAVFVQMPEGTVNGPPGRLGPFRPGAAVIAIRTGATIVPLAMAGTEELYVGRRMASRVLVPTTARELLGDAWDGAFPEPDSRAELELARRVSETLAARIGPVVEALHPLTVDPPDQPRRLRRRLTWLLLGPGPLEH